MRAVVSKREKFHVMRFANGIVVVFSGDNDRPVDALTGRFSFWRWLRIWWMFR